MEKTNIDLTQTVPSETITYLNLSQILIISTIVILTFVFFKRYKSRFMPLVTGILGNVIFTVIGYNLITYLIFSIPGMNEGYENNQLILKLMFFIVYIILFTLARYIVGRYLFQIYNRPGDILSFGLGMGICDGIMYSVTSITFSIWSTGINKTGMVELFKDFSESEITTTYNSISTLFTSPSILWVLLGLSVIIDILLNCGLAVIIYGAINKKITSIWVYISALINYVVIIPFKIYDETSYNNIVTLFLIKTILFVGSMYIIYRIDNEYIGGIISYNGKGDLKKSSGMPKFGKINRK